MFIQLRLQSFPKCPTPKISEELFQSRSTYLQFSVCLLLYLLQSSATIRSASGLDLGLVKKAIGKI